MVRTLVALMLTLLMSAHVMAAKQKIIDANNLYPQVKLETSMGVIIIELNRVKAPLAVNNFLWHVVSKEYDNTIFHRVIEDFVVQGGGYDANFIPRKERDSIFNESGNGLKNTYGTVAMARQHDPHSAKRQFFFNVGENTELDPGRNWGYTVFAHVTWGDEVLDKMAMAETDFHEGQSWPDVPIEPIILISASLLPADYIHEP
ncbi:peptidylprolyl isomerase [Thalassotalea sp. Y01]|uniref:peptidylprolyl isomerase n=1 Tax=Thalassotalea sp. Y01 TaxID=2729613 RepID=UPI00145DBA6E|nr:peptidylprolyl isomerase [Thalassotalea sp. Y01]NMP17891.1 peptidyl-prolyl cis-trans isomerase [Thalassotalea sp. Y01]